MIDENKLQETMDLIHEISPNANVITTKLDEINDQQLLEILESNDSLKDLMIEEVVHEHHHEECCHHEFHEHKECCCKDHHEHHEHEECCKDHHHHEECCCVGHHKESSNHHAEEVFTSWGIETVYSISKEQLTLFLEFLKTNEELGIVVRSKGILKAKEKNSWYYFDFVAGDYTIKDGNPDYTGRIVVIGSKLNTNQIHKRFLELVK